MKKSNRLYQWLKGTAGVLLLLAVLAVGLSADVFAIVSHAASTGKVTASSAKIRQEPSTSSEVLASALQNAVVDVKGQTTGSDGYTWYQVSDGSVTGYIRSDLMEITDGSTPATIVTPTAPSNTTSTPTTSTPDEPLVSVTEVEPVSGSVSGGSQVRVRQNASTTSRIVTTARSGLALTVTGTAIGTDGEEWRRVSFISGGSEVTGFIRKDYVTVSGDLVPLGEGTEQPETPNDQEPEPEPENTKDWDTYYEGEKWHLLDNTSGNTWDIAQIFSVNEANSKTLETMLDKNRTQQIIIIILVILLIVMAIAISFLVFKLKDMTDSAYFNEVERETARRRTADRPAERTGGRTQGGQRVMQTVGAEGARRPAGSAQRPTGQRPAGQTPAGSQTVRPAGSAQRPAGQRPAGTQAERTGDSAQRPVGQRPAGAQAARPVDSAQRSAGQRSAGAQAARTDDSAQRPASQRPVNRQPERTQRPTQSQPDYDADYDSGYGQAYEQAPPAQEPAPAQPKGKTGWKAKNFINDDEFEFQFLDWEDDQK